MKTYLQIVLIALLTVMSAFATDRIILGNGKQYDGKVRSLKNGFLEIETGGSRRKVRLRDVKEIVFDLPEAPVDKAAVCVQPAVQRAVQSETAISAEAAAVLANPGKAVGKYTITELNQRPLDLNGKLIKLEFNRRDSIHQTAAGEYSTRIAGPCQGITVKFGEKALKWFKFVDTQYHHRKPKQYYLFCVVDVRQRPDCGGSMRRTVELLPVGRKLSRKPGGKLEYSW